jgi:hypothetical protein
LVETVAAFFSFLSCFCSLAGTLEGMGTDALGSLFSVKLDIACNGRRRNPMNQIIYLVGLIVVIMFILSFFGLR